MDELTEHNFRPDDDGVGVAVDFNRDIQEEEPTDGNVTEEVKEGSPADKHLAELEWLYFRSFGKRARQKDQKENKRDAEGPQDAEPSAQSQ